jgi:hypothetical protein
MTDRKDLVLTSTAAGADPNYSDRITGPIPKSNVNAKKKHARVWKGPVQGQAVQTSAE